MARAFRLERARLVVVPLGVDQVVASLLGQGMAASKLSLDLAHQAIEVLRLTFDKESDATNLEIALDGPDGELPGAAGRAIARSLTPPASSTASRASARFTLPHRPRRVWSSCSPMP